MPKLLDENSLQAVKTVLDTKENVGNKVALGASNTTSQYPNAKSVWDEVVNLHEIAEGKCRSYVLSYDNNLPYSTQQYFRFQYYDLDGKLNNFTSESELNAWLSGRNALNSSFNSQNGEITITGLNDFIILDGNNRAILLPLQAADNVFRKGDNIFVIELLVPDRWVKSISVSGTTTLTLQKLEATKVDLTQYPTKTEVATDFSNIVADEYDNTQTYAVGDLCLHNMQLYKCITAISVAEDFDSSKWVAVKINGEFARDSEVVKLTGDQTVSGAKTFSEGVIIQGGSKSFKLATDNNGLRFLYQDSYVKLNITNTSVAVNAHMIPQASSYDIGSTSSKWRDLYISGNITDGTYKTTVADIYNGLFNVINASDIVNNTLTPEQYALITNGKPTQIIGTLDGKVNPYLPILTSAANNIAVKHQAGLCLGELTQTKLYLRSGGSFARLILENVYMGYFSGISLGGKTFPAYPSDTTIPYKFIQSVGGTLAYSQTCIEWYGTQAQYDALGTYDSNTIYNILES